MENIKNALKNFSISDIIELEEKDRQFKALCNLYKTIENKELFLKLAVTNALLSYQLQTTGEVYWENFSLYFSKHPTLKAFLEFLKTYNKRFLKAKLKRLDKILTCIKNEELSLYCGNLPCFIEKTSFCMNQKKDAKTIVFAAKILLYGCRIIDKEKYMAPCGIFVPLDSRLKKINKEKGFWKTLEKKTKIPLLHIDSIIWITMGMNEKDIQTLKKPLKEKVEKIRSFLCYNIEKRR